MYSLKVYLVGCDPNAALTQDVRREVKKRWSRIQGEYPSVEAAKKGIWVAENEPVLIIARLKSIEELAVLRQHCGPSPEHAILALLDIHADHTIVVKAMHAGATQVAVLPLEADDFVEALNCIAAKIKSNVESAQTIVVAGATGGSGSTTIALNLADEIAVHKRSCILAELAMRMGTLATYLNAEVNYTINDLAMHMDRLDSFLVEQSLTKINDYLAILAGPHDAIPSELPDVEGIFQVLEVLRQIAKVLVIDLPATFDDSYFRALAMADQTILVVEQSVVSIRGAHLVCQAMGNSHVPLIVVNRYDPKAQGLNADRIRDFLKPCEVLTVAADEAMIAASNSGHTLRTENPKSPALVDIQKIFQRLMPDAVSGEEPKDQPTLWNRLTSALALS